VPLGVASTLRRCLGDDLRAYPSIGTLRCLFVAPMG
jgi:hypothetical protein